VDGLVPQPDPAAFDASPRLFERISSSFDEWRTTRPDESK
jgi:hypothetical protein